MKPVRLIAVVLACLAALSFWTVLAAPRRESPASDSGQRQGAGIVQVPSGERLINGSFEQGFAPDGLALGWHSFGAGPAVAAFYDDTWSRVVYDGAHSQLIEINSFVTPTETPPGTTTATLSPAPSDTTIPGTTTATLSPTPSNTATPGTPTTPSPAPSDTATPTPSLTLSSTPGQTGSPTVPVTSTTSPTATGTNSPSVTSTPQAQGTVEHPKGIVSESVNHRLFVASRDTNSVDVLDEATLARVHSPISVGRQPFGVALAGAQLFVANFASGSVSVIDTTTLDKLPDIDVSSCGGEPTHLAANSSTNRLYVTLHASARVAVIDTDTRTLAGCVPVGSGTFGIAVDPVLNQVYVGNRDSHDLWVIDGATNQARPVVTFEQGKVQGNPYFVSFDTATRRLFVVVALPDPVVNQLFVYQASSSGLTLAKQMTVGDTSDGGWIITSPCSRLTYIAATAAGAIWILNPDLTVNQVLTDQSIIGADPYSLAANPPLGLIYIGNRTPGTIRALSEKCTTAQLHSARLPGLASLPADPLLPIGTVGGIYQTIAVVQGATYTLSMHGMMRVNPGDRDQNKGNLVVQWGIDPNGGSDWIAVSDWTTLPWNVQYLREKPGPMLDYTTTFVAPSNKLTVFFRVWRKTFAPNLELDTNLDGLSLFGPVPAE